MDGKAPELLAIDRALDELTRIGRDLRQRLGNTLDVRRFAEDVARLRIDGALLAPILRERTTTPRQRAPIPDEDYDATLWRHDDEGLGGFARTLGARVSRKGHPTHGSV